jgi:hypothetical protein
MKRALFLAAVLLGACGKKPAPTPASEIDYTAKDGGFSARLPAAWRVDETRGESRGAAFFGPSDGPHPYSQMIAVYFHAAAVPKPGTGDETVEQRVLKGPRGAPVRLTVRTVVVAAPGGFYSLEYSTPEDAQPLPAFDAFRKSFRPRAAAP